MKLKRMAAKIFGRKNNDRASNLETLKKERASGREQLDAFPVVLYLEAAAICNLRCPMCPTTMGIPRDPYRVKIFDFKLLPRVEPILPFVHRCFLSGGGEPLLHPRFFDLVKVLKDNGVETYFNCNATLMDEEKAAKILDLGVDTISFSIDGATRETYERIRVGAQFDKVIENVARLSKMKKSRGQVTPYINSQFTVTRGNAHEIVEAVRVAASLSVNQLVVEPLTPVFCFDREYEKYYRENLVPSSEIIGRAREAREEAEKLGVIFSSHYLFKDECPDPPRTCVQPWTTLGVRVDGRVFTCCGTMEQMGDLAVQEIGQIWNGEKYRSLRRAAASGQFPDFCSLCLSENRANHFNEDILLD